MDVGETIDFPSRTEGIRAAMKHANREAMRSGDEVVVTVCQGAGKCHRGNPMTCQWCERITCLPSGEIKHAKPSVC